MKKRIGLTVLALLVIFAMGFFTYTSVQKSQTAQFNQAFLENYQLYMSQAENAKDSLKILKTEIQKMDLSSNKDKITMTTRSTIESDWNALQEKMRLARVAEQQRKDDETAWEKAKNANTTKAYIAYTKSYNLHEEEAFQRIEKIQDDLKRIAANVNQPKPYAKSVSEVLQPRVSANKKSQSLVIRGFTCRKQQEVVGKDRITIKVNDKNILKEHLMVTGDHVDLTPYIKPISLNSHSAIAISVVEQDRWSADLIFNMSIIGNVSEPGLYEREGRTPWGGNYVLLYEIR